MFWRTPEEPNNYWLSYTDLVTGFMIIFIVIALILFTRTNEKDPLEGKYKELVDVFSKKFWYFPEIEITDQATVRFLIDGSQESPLFRLTKSSPTTYFRGVLDKFVPLYYEEVFQLFKNSQDSFRIKEIRIEGHTDSKGDYLTNLELSSNRAFKVQAYVLRHPFFFSIDPEFEEFIKQNSIACGYSFSRLLDAEGRLTSESKGLEAADQSRRVEFRLMLEYIEQ